MLSSSLNSVIVIESRQEVKNSQGSPKFEWQIMGTRRAMVIYGSGNKGMDTNMSEMISTSNVTFIVRYIGGLNNSCRIRFDDSIYEIQSLEKLRRREGYKIVTLRKDNV